MAVDAINPTAAGVSILFADPNLSFPSVSALLGSDAICVDLDQCVEPDGSLASKCLTLLKDAEQKKVDVILAAKPWDWTTKSNAGYGGRGRSASPYPAR